MLSTRSSKSVPMVIGFNGKHNSFLIHFFILSHMSVATKIIQARLMTI